FIAAALLGSATAQAQTWVKTTAPDTLYYSRVLTVGNDTIYAFAGVWPSSGHLVSSFDGGKTWSVNSSTTRMNGAIATPFGVHVNYQYNVSMSVQYTQDGGKNWGTITGSTDQSSEGGHRAIAVRTDGKMLFATLVGYQKTSDDYLTLSPRFGSAYEYTFEWEYQATNPNTGRILLGRNSGSNQVSATDDNGLTFTRQTKIHDIWGNIYAPIVRYSNANNFYNGCSGGIIKSTDNGENWAKIGMPAGNPGPMSDFQVNRFDHVLRVHGGESKIYLSTDGGVTFNAANNGIGASVAVGPLGSTRDGSFWMASSGTAASPGGIYKLETAT
ncbi:MAG: hypothetical protein V4616_05855, partial [Bacteroidota bacterium]